MRPIYHWRPERIRTHILICYLAFVVSRFTLEKINRGCKETLDEEAISFDQCIEELSRIESHIRISQVREGVFIYREVCKR